MIEVVGSAPIVGAVATQISSPTYTAVKFGKRSLEKVPASGVSISKDGTWKNKSAEIIKTIKIGRAHV